MDGRTEEEARTMLGLLDSAFLVTYAVCMFASGLVAERVDLRLYLSLGMVSSGLACLLLGLARPLGIHSFWYLAAVQALSGLLQTTGWPGVVTVMANWFGKGKRGLIMGLWNSHTSLGNILGALVAGAFVTSDWGLAFALPGILIIACGGLVHLFLVPDPSVVGLSGPRSKGTTSPTSSPSLPRSSSQPRIADTDSSETETTSLVRPDSQAIGFCGALRIPGVIEFSLCLFFAKLVSYTFLFWLPNYIASTSGLDARSAATLSTFFDVGGILGGVMAGLISDQSGMSATTCAAMLVAAVPTLLAYQSSLAWCPLVQVSGLPVLDSCYLLSTALLILTGLLVNGPYALITTAVSAELGTHRSLAGSGRALATVTSIIDGTGSLGAAVGPFLAGWLAGGGAWDRVFLMLVAADLMALLLLARLMKSEVRRCWRRRFSF
jgi:OPA family glycerol-3-phosphate transporter-like MFS transporter 1/2